MKIDKSIINAMTIIALTILAALERLDINLYVNIVLIMVGYGVGVKHMEYKHKKF